jgi:hypothetical protein
MKKAALVLLLIAGPVVAQQPEPERKAAPAGGLNLRLNEADLRSLSRNSSGLPAPTEDKAADGLPSLGGDARKFEQPKPSSDTRRPYPPDTGQMHGR